MNQTVGQYRILALLGEGGMGAVYAAEDTLLDIKVALKSLRAELTKTPELAERFREEAKIQVKLNNPHIVKLYTFMREGQDYYIVMEFVEGRTLGSFVERVGRLGYRDAIQIMAQTLDGLEHAHRLGVIHRDIKLNNIMITPEGTVKVMDFGIARVLGSRRLTRAGNIVGTLDYISPEALNGQEITPAADIYSCGIMLYKMVTGSLPFISENDYLLARMHVEVPPPPPTVHVPDLPRKLEEVILKALAKIPADRFQSAGQMAQALEQVDDGDDVRGDGERDGSSPFWRRFTTGKPPTGRGESGSQSARVRPGASVAAAATANRRIEELMTQNRMREAMDLVQRSLQEFPADTTLRDLRARIEREQRHYEEDLRRSAQEIRGYLDRGLAEMALSAAETQLNRYSGEVSLMELLEEARRQVQEKKQKAEAATLVEEEIRPLVQEGRFSEAIAIVVEAVSLNPEQPALSALLGRTIKAQRDREKRQQILECREEAEKLAKEGHYDQAIARIEHTRLNQPDDPSLLTLLRQLLEARDDAKKRADLERVYRKIDELVGSGRLDDADSALEVAFRRFPRDQKVQAKRKEIQAQIAERKRLDGMRRACRNVDILRESGEWINALAEIDLAVERLGPDPAFDELRAEIQTSQREYRQRVDTAANEVQERIKAGEFESAIESSVDLCKAFSREEIFTQLQAEARAGLAAKEKRLRIRSLVEEADRLVAGGAADKASSLLAEASAELSQEPELEKALDRVCQAQKLEARQAATKAAIQRVASFRKSDDWAGGARMLAEALAANPAIAELEEKLKEFEGKAEAKRRAEALRLAEEECRKEVARLVERSDWKLALQSIERKLAEFPGTESLLQFEQEIDGKHAAWIHAQELNSAVTRIESLLASARLDEARAVVEREWERFPEAEIFLNLSVRLEGLREEAQAQQARKAAASRASGLVSSHLWDEAESVLSEAESRLGSDGDLADVRRKLETARRDFESKAAKCISEVESLLRADQWQEAIAIAEKLLQEYPEADEIRKLLDRTNREFKSWRRTKEVERALQIIRGILEGRRWDDAQTAAESGRLRFPDAEEAFASLAKQAAEGRASAYRKERIAGAVDRASRFAEERRWNDAAAELDRAETEFGTNPAIEVARGAISSDRKKHDDAVGAACVKARKFIDSSKWEQALKELAPKIFDGEHEVGRLRRLAEDGKTTSERQKRLAQALSTIEESIARGEWADVSAGLQAADREFPREPSVAALRAAAAAAQEQEKREVSIKAVLAEAERQTDPGAAFEIIARELQQSGEHQALRQASARFEKIKAKRQQESVGMVANASKLIANGDPSGALRYLEGLSPEWRHEPEWIALAQQAREVAGVAEERQRETEIASAVRKINELLASGASTQSKTVAQQYLGRFPSAPSLQEAAKKVDAALDFESRIRKCLASGRFDDAETAWLEGGDFPSVADLGSEIERHRADHERASAEFALRVRLLIRESRLDEAARAIDDGSKFAPLPDSLRSELAGERTQLAARQRIAEYGRKLGQAWAAGDLTAAGDIVQSAVQTDGESPSVFEWMLEHERKRAEWDQRRKLDQFETRFKRGLESNDLDACREIVDRVFKEFPTAPQLGDWTLRLRQQQERAHRAEETLRLASGLVEQGHWKEALEALEKVPAGTPSSQEEARLRRSIQEGKLAAERSLAPPPQPVPVDDRTMVTETPKSAQAPTFDSQAAIPVPEPPAKTKGPLVAILALAAVAVVAMGVWLSRDTGERVELSVSKAKLEFPGPGVQTIRVNSPVSVPYSVSGGDAWIDIREKSGKTPGVLTVEAKSGQLAPGRHRTVIVIQADVDGRASKKEVEVILQLETKKATATQQPVLTVLPRALNIVYQVSQPLPAARRLELSGAKPDQCKVRVAKGADWLNATIGPGSAVTVSFRLSGKSAGSYAGELEITVAGGATTRIPVNLEIQAFKL